MRHLLFSFLLGLGSVTLQAGDAAPTQYSAVFTGIVCQSCKATVTDALKKLPGVKEVEFAKGEKEGAQKLTFTAGSASLSKNDVELALGEHVKEFAIVSLEKSK